MQHLFRSNLTSLVPLNQQRRISGEVVTISLRRPVQTVGGVGLQNPHSVQQRMYHPVKRQRALDEQSMAASPNKEHVTPLHGGGRQGQSGAGGDLRLDVASSLNRTEADILGIMIEAVNLSKAKTVVRVAGGWVRDKLLGLENDDIDLALDDCKGVDFAEVVKIYLKSTGRDQGKVAVIEANPDQSKHLQTARMKIMGVWIDLVNLRTETYSFKLSTSINIGLESPISSSLSIEASRTSRLTVATCFPRTSTVYWPAIGSRVSTYTSAYALVHPSIAIPNNVRLVQTLSGRVRAAEVSKKQSFVDIMDSSDSRIPEASFGTAEEDALRRDFTLNALFFNVNDGKIEDMTGRGIDDLREGIIRTPLPPMITFQDDPLRLMRAVRFAARFGFALHEDLRAAARDSKIQAALCSKVSRERVGVELSGMLTGKRAQPALALSLLQELGLCAAVYDPPPKPIPAAPEGGYDWARGAAVARAASRVLDFRAGEGVKAAGDETRRQPSSLPPAEAVIASGGAAPSDGTTVVGGEGATQAVVGGVMGVGVMGGDEASATIVATAVGEAESKSAGMMEGNGVAKAASGDKAEGVSCGGGGNGDDPTTLVRELFLCAALLPLAGVKHKVKKGKLAAAAQSVVQESLKLKSREAKNVAEILELAPTFRSLADAYAANTAGNVVGALETGDGGSADTEGGAGFSRLAVGLAVRQARELWPTCVTLCCAVEMCQAQDEGSAQTDVDGSVGAPPRQTTGSVPAGSPSTASTGKRTRGDEGKGSAEQGVESEQGGNEPAIIEKYIRFEKAVATMGLGRAWDMAPLVRGNELMVELKVPKGPEVGKLMAKQASWQLGHPEGTREQCIAFLRATL